MVAYEHVIGSRRREMIFLHSKQTFLVTNGKNVTSKTNFSAYSKIVLLKKNNKVEEMSNIGNLTLFSIFIYDYSEMACWTLSVD